MPVRIAIAEDNSFALKSILDKLGSIPGMHVKYTAYQGEQLLDDLRKDANVDVVLMDIQMPGLGGVETTRQLTQKYPQVKVIMLTTFDDDEKIFQSILAGASGYLLKEESAGTIHKAIVETLEGGAPMSPAIALKVLRLLRNPIGTTQAKEEFGLTVREIELLEQLKNGLTYDQIASNLFISSGTVRKHIENIYRKLQVNNKVEAVQKASQHRLV